MKSLNRLAIIVTPREPYWVWARGIDADARDAGRSPDEYSTVYLVETPDEFEPEELIEQHFAAIFEEQLHSWHRDESRWPQRRTEAMFREWFDCRVSELVWDLGRTRLKAE